MQKCLTPHLKLQKNLFEVVDSPLKILILFETRPEAIKLAPVIHELSKKSFQTIIVSSSQHNKILKPFLKLFEISVDFDLRVMKKNQKFAIRIWPQKCTEYKDFEKQNRLKSFSQANQFRWAAPFAAWRMICRKLHFGLQKIHRMIHRLFSRRTVGNFSIVKTRRSCFFYLSDIQSLEQMARARCRFDGKFANLEWRRGKWRNRNGL